MTDKEWNEKLRKDYYAWCSDDQWECCNMVFDLIHGEHHLTGKIKPCGLGIEYNTQTGGMATFDFSGLTTAVFMAHDRLIRFSIDSSGPRLVKWRLFKRHKREGNFSEKHPTIETALAEYRKCFKEPEE